jgi:calcineurin-like phosphoesterase family protein
MPKPRSGPKAEDYVIADLHLGHNNIINMPGREVKVYNKIPEQYGGGRSVEMGIEKRVRFDTPEIHDNYVIERINHVVPKGAHLWILGDVAFNKRGFLRLKEIHCTMSAVLGNHDKADTSLYAELFDSVHGAVKGTCDEVDFIMTHIPVHPCQKERFGCNIHGHMHDKCLDDDFYSLVSCEHIDFNPVTVREAIFYNGIF